MGRAPATDERRGQQVAGTANDFGRAGLALIVASAIACSGGRGHDTGSGWLGDTHARPTGGDNGGSGGEVVPLSASEARVRLDQAHAATEADGREEILRYADALAVAGGALTSTDRQAVLRAVDEVREHRLSALYEQLPGAGDQARTLAARAIALRLALIAEHSGDDAEALRWLKRLGDEQLSTTVDGANDSASDSANHSGDRSLSGHITSLRARIRARADSTRTRAQVDPRVVAVLLPLSGQFSRLGHELRSAVRFANEIDKRRTTLVFLDTTGTEDGARAAVDQAVSTHHALAILGPVGERESLSAARRAAELDIPIGLLSPGEGAGRGTGVFRLWSSPEWEAREAARLAIETGHDRLAVLAPRDEHGQAASQAFAEAARERGLQLVKSGTYDPSSANLEADAKAFLGLDPRTNPRLRRHLRRHGYKRGWQSFSPDVKFDLLYIPDDYQRAALIVAFLPYFNVEVRSRDAMDIAYLKRKHRGRVPQVVQLLGSSGWHHASLIPRGGSAVEGALLVDIYAGSDVEEFSSEQAARFAEAFDSWAGRQPSALTAQAFDAATMMLQVRAQVADGARARARSQRRDQGKSGRGRAERSLRAAFARTLARARLSDGVCGAAQMTAMGVIDRRASLLRIDGGTFVLHEY